MKLRDRFIVIFAVIVLIIISRTFVFKEKISLVGDCVSYKLGSFEYEKKEVEISGVIKKKLFQREHEADIEIRIGDIVYPLDTRVLKSYPSGKYIHTYAFRADRYYLLPLDCRYWNNKDNILIRKNHGNLYLDIENQIFCLVTQVNSGYEDSILEEGNQIIMTGSSIIDALDTIKENFDWQLDNWLRYYRGSNQH